MTDTCRTLKEYYGLCIKADLRNAKRVFQRPKGKKLRDLAVRYQSRFLSRIAQSRVAVQDAFARTVILAYRRYYKQALLQSSNRRIFEKQLKGELATLVGMPSAKSFDDIERAIAKELLRRGFHSKPGLVKPLRNILVWKSERAKIYTVKLPSKTHTVPVLFLERFLELGWLHFATFGRYYVGGWAEKNRLVCVAKAYKRRPTDFRVSYLIHETQHFDDYRRFPSLAGGNLEYRAKLCELIFHPHPNKLLKHFQMMAADDRHNPHAWASHKIVSSIPTGLMRARISKAASELLRLDTERLKRIQRRKRGPRQS